MKSVSESVEIAAISRSRSWAVSSFSSSPSSARIAMSRVASSRRSSSNSRSCSSAKTSSSAWSTEPRSSASSRNALKKLVVMLKVLLLYVGWIRRVRTARRPRGTAPSKNKTRLNDPLFPKILQGEKISVRVPVLSDGPRLRHPEEQGPRRPQDRRGRDRFRSRQADGRGECRLDPRHRRRPDRRDHDRARLPAEDHARRPDEP